MLWLYASLFLLFLLLAGGLWISFSIGLASILAFWPHLGLDTIYLTGLHTWGISASFTMLAVPMFIFLAEIVAATGIGNRAYTGVEKLIRGAPGGLPQSNILACAVFASISGSSVATAATVGKIAYPELVRRGYDQRIITGSLAAGGTLGILIPPSIIMIIYADIAEQSVGRLFLAGVVPGLVLAALFMIWIGLWPRLTGQTRVEDALAAGGLKSRLQGLVELWPLFVLAFTVLGGIYGGVVTASEAAGLGATVAMLLAFVMGQMTWKILGQAALNTIVTVSMLFLIVIAGNIMAKVLAYYGVPPMLVQWTEEIGSPVILLAIIWVMYLLLGTVFEGLSMMLLTIPFILPIVAAAGFDLIWFGVFLVILVESGMLTPPVGMNLFVIQGITRTPLNIVVRGSLPFLVLMQIGVLIFTLWPPLVLWLPGWVMG